MRQANGFNWILRGGTATAAVLLLTASLSADVVATDAKVSTFVQELIGGEPASVTADDAELGADDSTLPLLASSELTSTDLEGAIVSLAQAFSVFTDPARLDQPNPAEFAVEVGCYSNTPDVSYSVFSDAVESRTVLFASRGAGAPEIDFGFDRTAEVESSVFLSGAVILWSTEPRPPLAPTWAELRVAVTRDDTDALVFESTLTVATGDSAGIQVTPTGSIEFETVELEELAGFGPDQESLAVLAQVELSGELLVLVLPPQEHTYTYTVTADEVLTLTARLEIRAANAPEGTGVAATLGRPFEGLVEFMEIGLPGVDGEAVQLAINLAASASDTDSPADVGAGTCGNGRFPCGAFGLECVALLAFLTLVGPRRRLLYQ